MRDMETMCISKIVQYLHKSGLKIDNVLEKYNSMKENGELIEYIDYIETDLNKEEIELTWIGFIKFISTYCRDNKSNLVMLKILYEDYHIERANPTLYVGYEKFNNLFGLSENEIEEENKCIDSLDLDSYKFYDYRQGYIYDSDEYEDDPIFQEKEKTGWQDEYHKKDGEVKFVLDAFKDKPMEELKLILLSRIKSVSDCIKYDLLEDISDYYIFHGCYPNGYFYFNSYKIPYKLILYIVYNIKDFKYSYSQLPELNTLEEYIEDITKSRRKTLITLEVLCYIELGRYDNEIYHIFDLPEEYIDDI